MTLTVLPYVCTMYCVCMYGRMIISLLLLLLLLCVIVYCIANCFLSILIMCISRFSNRLSSYPLPVESQSRDVLTKSDKPHLIRHGMDVTLQYVSHYQTHESLYIYVSFSLLYILYNST